MAARIYGNQGQEGKSYCPMRMTKGETDDSNGVEVDEFHIQDSFIFMSKARMACAAASASSSVLKQFPT